MNGAGLFLVVAAIWLASQVTVGRALENLGIIDGDQSYDPLTGLPPKQGQGGDGGLHLPKVPDIPLVPQGPLTGIPFSPIDAKLPAHHSARQASQ